MDVTATTTVEVWVAPVMMANTASMRSWRHLERWWTMLLAAHCPFGSHDVPPSKDITTRARREIYTVVDAYLPNKVTKCRDTSLTVAVQSGHFGFK